MESPLLSVANVNVVFGSSKVLKSVSLEVRAAELVGLIGPNGAGKTTLFDVITGYAKLKSGTVLFEGVNISRWPVFKRARRGLRRTFQGGELFADLSVRENITVGMSGSSSSAASVGVDLDDGLHEFLDTPCGSLPAGLARRVGLARALAGQPSLLLADEPAAGLSSAEVRELASRLRAFPAHGISALIVDHDVSLIADVCDRIYVLNFGEVIACGTPVEIQSNAAVGRAYLGR